MTLAQITGWTLTGSRKTRIPQRKAAYVSVVGFSGVKFRTTIFCDSKCMEILMTRDQILAYLADLTVAVKEMDAKGETDCAMAGSGLVVAKHDCVSVGEPCLDVTKNSLTI